MPKITDQEFDNLFRQAANRITPEPQSGDWEDMQRKLEAAERDARARNISLYSMVALLLLYSFLMPVKSKFDATDNASMVPAIEKDRTAPPGDAKDTPLNIQEATVAPQGTNVTESNSLSESRNLSESKKLSESTNTRELTRTEEANQKVERNRDGNPSAVDRNSKEKTATSGITRDNADQQALLESQSSASGQQALVDAQAIDKQQGSVSSANADRSGDSHVKESGSGVTDVNQSGNATGTKMTDIKTDNTVTGMNVAGKIVADNQTGVKATGINKNGSIGTAGAISDNNGELAGGVAGAAAVTGYNRNSTGTATTENEALEIPATDPLFADPSEKLSGVTLSPPGRVVAEMPSAHPWFVKLSVSPDFSSIDYGSAGKTGVNFGPMVEYSLSPRFSVSTGAIWSKKLYDQENPEKSYGQGGYTTQAKMLNGDCRILDIPLNVTYYIMPGRKTNLFVTVGSSSYIMLNEEYVYTVSRNSYDYEYVENYSHKNNEWFSMLNLSFGIQHQLDKRWFIQGEPFLKAPMKGVGEGKVNLVSAGVFVSVKYLINP